METLTIIVLWMAGHPYVMLSILVGLAALWKLSQVPKYYNEYAGFGGTIKFYLRSIVVVSLLVILFMQGIVHRLKNGELTERDVW